MTRIMSPESEPRRLAIAVRGVVQGVGFRPFVYHAARTCGLSGWVQNENDAVRIEVQGGSVALDDFCRALRQELPPQARIDSFEVREIDRQDGQSRDFQIRTSAAEGMPRPTIPADLATCPACLAEIRAPGERRYRYPFTNCTNCGPRWSIIVRLPYDRSRTSMAGFALCPDCQAEYRDPADRRFHAQPIACPVCGPTIELLDCDGRRLASGQQALERAAQSVLAGRILALKGLGGFQLVVDATNAEAVRLLRQRKRRPDKPLAVMFGTLEDVRRVCDVSGEEANELASAQAPILLVRRRNAPLFEAATSSVALAVEDAVAPGNPYLGAMLPYTPLHHLLLAAVGRPIVCTSGNRSEEPMAISVEDARSRLGTIADLMLTHNRPIVRPVDDSVARVGPDGLQVLRRARGYAPLPITLKTSIRSESRDRWLRPQRPNPSLGPEQRDQRSRLDGTRVILAVGGHLKNTVALGLGSQVILSPHVGDLDNRLSVEVHGRAIADLVDFFGVTPQRVACDLHPDYASTRHAEQLAAAWDVPLVQVQHHHAHVAACMAEHGLEGPVLGFSWDGTGYGTDGTVWGGEMLICQGAEFRRLAHLRSFALPGGDRAVRQPRRSALGVLFEILGDGAAEHVAGLFAPAELSTLLTALARGVHSPRTSSMGRLFDAVAALCGLPATISFEGQSAMALEFAADPQETGAYDLPLTAGAPTPRCIGGESVVPTQSPLSLGRRGVGGEREEVEGPAVADWEPMLRAVLDDRAAGVPVAVISVRFHNALARLAVAVARQWGGSQVVLTGGCFQNALLSERVRNGLVNSGFRVSTHRQVPPGDGGIALGQLAVAAWQD